MCMRQTGTPLSADDAAAGWIGEGGDIVDHGGAGGDGEDHRLGMAGVDGDEAVALARLLGDGADDREDALLLDRRRHRLGARPRRFTADIEDIGAFLHQRDGVGDGAFGRVEAAAVGEGIGRDVDDAHQERRRPAGRGHWSGRSWRGCSASGLPVCGWRQSGAMSAERHQDEGALMHARMRQDEVGRVEPQLVIGDDVEVEGARGVCAPRSRPK